MTTTRFWGEMPFSTVIRRRRSDEYSAREYGRSLGIKSAGHTRSCRLPLDVEVVAQSATEAERHWILHDGTAWPLFILLAQSSIERYLEAPVSIRETWPINLERSVRYCDLCAKEQREKYGLSWWISDHNLPWVMVCPRHEKPLQSIPTSKAIGGRGLLPHENRNSDDTPTPREAFALAQYARFIAFVSREASAITHSSLDQFLRSGNENAPRLIDLVAELGGRTINDIEHLQRDHWLSLYGSMDSILEECRVDERFRDPMYYGRQLISCRRYDLRNFCISRAPIDEILVACKFKWFLGEAQNVCAWLTASCISTLIANSCLHSASSIEAMHPFAIELAILRQLSPIWLDDWLRKHAGGRERFPPIRDAEAGLSVFHSRLRAEMGCNNGVGRDACVRRNMVCGEIVDEWGESFAGACLRYLDEFFSRSTWFASAANRFIRENRRNAEAWTTAEYLQIFDAENRSREPSSKQNLVATPDIAPTAPWPIVLSNSGTPTLLTTKESSLPERESRVHAHRTDKTYRSAIQHFASWGGLLPCTEEDVIRNLLAFANSKKASSLYVHLAALSSWHSRQGFPNPATTSKVRKTFDAIRNSQQKPIERTMALSLEQVERIVQNLKDDNSLSNIRNSALIQVGFFGAYTCSELIGLDIAQLTWSENRVVITHPRSTKVFPISQGICCPMSALQSWVTVAKIASGPVFRRIDRWGNVGDHPIHTTSLGTILVSCAAAAGIDDCEKLSGRSLRWGFVASALETGAMPLEVQRHVGWRAADTALGHIKEFEDPNGDAIRRLL